jgi:threonine dehydrogenase-like Zn-dependent dehydrogenase
MYSVAVVDPGKVELVEIPKPKPGPFDALVRTEVGYLCNSTDGEIIAGRFPGCETFPLLLGHESAGIVESTGNKVTSYKVGDRVVGGLLLEPPDAKYKSGFGGFSEYTIVRDHQAMLAAGVAEERFGWNPVHKIQKTVPADIPAEAAGLLCTWREVLSSFQDFDLKPGDNILVFGGGPVGLSFVKFARLQGLAHVGCVDTHPEKQQKARVLGADDAFGREDPRLDPSKNTGMPQLDKVIDAVGRVQIINRALALVRWGGTVCVYGFVAEHPICLDNLRGPVNVSILLHQWPTRDYEAASQDRLCQWLREGKLSSEEFISAEFKIQDINLAIEHVNSRRAIKALLRF